MFGLVCKMTVVLLVLLANFSVSAAPGLFELPASRSVRLIRSDPSSYDGYENSFYRGYGSDNQQFRFNSPPAW